MPATPEAMREHARVLEALANGLEKQLAEYEQAEQAELVEVGSEAS